jgi:hypothetical protein
MILENNCVMGNLVYRGYEEEYANGVNGYEKGETISIRRPTDFTVRSGAVAAIQEVVEGKTSLTVDTQEGVDFKFTSSDLTCASAICPARDQAGDGAACQLDRYQAGQRSTRMSGTGWVRPARPSTPSPTSRRRRPASISARFRWMTVTRSSRRPTNTACSARRLHCTCRTWPRTPIAIRALAALPRSIPIRPRTCRRSPAARPTTPRRSSMARSPPPGLRPKTPAR